MRSNLLFGAVLCLAVLFFSITLWAGTTGKITGVVTDNDTGEPMMAANVELLNANGNTVNGTSTGLDGEYLFLDVRPGMYDLRVSAVGYTTVEKKNIIVYSDKTTTVNVEMSATAIAGSTIVVEENKVEKIRRDATASESYTTSDEISTMPVNDVSEVLSTKVGVTTQNGQLHFRGGRSREVSYQIDGMPVQDPTYGYQAIDVSTGAVQEIQVQTGAFNAEYGGALSAIVSIVTKQGDPNKFAGNIDYSTTNFRVDALNKYTTNSDRLEFSISGPEPFSTYLLPMLGLRIPRDKRISYFFSIAGENQDTRTPYNKSFDLDYSGNGAPIATSDEIYGPYKIDYGWFGLFPERRVNQYQSTFKLTQKLTPSFRYVLSYTGNWSKWRSFDWYYYYCPDFSYKNYQYAHQINLGITHNLSPKTFYEVKIGYMYTRRTMTPGDLDPGDFAVDSSMYGTLDDWVDVNGDGVAQVRLQWWDANGNGMWDYGEFWQPIIERIDTIWDDPITRQNILEVDTVYADTLPPQLGEEPWVDWNDNEIFEPRMTNYGSPLYGYYSLNLGEPFCDGEPFLDAYPYGLSYEDLMHGIETFDGVTVDFVDETLWVDINGNGVKDYGEYIFGSYYYANNVVFQEEKTWEDLNEDGNVDWGEYDDINHDGQYTMRDSWCNYIDANNNGRYDVGELGEPFLDLNGNGYWDPPNGTWDDWSDMPGAKMQGEPYLDRNGNGKWDEFSAFQYRGFDRWAVWHKRTTNIALVKGDLSSQMDKHNLVKTGLEFQWVRMNMNSIQYPEYKYDGVPDGMDWPEHGVFRSFYTRTPSSFSSYLQDKMEYGGLIANIGLRLDLFLQAPEVLVDTVAGDYRDVLQPWWSEDAVSKTKFKLSPRLGMSYPITEKSKLFFSYGHFYQLPGYDDFYQTPTQGSNAGRLLGNPNLSYEKTVAYELGVAYAFTENWTAQFSGYYKDIFDLLNTSHARLGPLEQDVYVNSDYARSRGVEFRLEKALSNYWSLSTNYSFAFAYGKSSSDRSGYDSQFDQTAIPLRDLPLDWDQRNNVNAVLDFRVKKDQHPKLFGMTLPSNWGVNFVMNWGSGFPYTPSKNNPKYVEKPGEKAWERTNALRMPDQFNVDMRFNKNFKISTMDWSFYMMVNNLTNTRNVTYVYEDTGEPDKSWVLTHEDGTYEFMGGDYEKNPTHWSAPIEIKLGINMGW